MSNASTLPRPLMRWPLSFQIVTARAFEMEGYAVNSNSIVTDSYNIAASSSSEPAVISGANCGYCLAGGLELSRGTSGLFNYISNGTMVASSATIGIGFSQNATGSTPLITHNDEQSYGLSGAFYGSTTAVAYSSLIAFAGTKTDFAFGTGSNSVPAISASSQTNSCIVESQFAHDPPANLDEYLELTEALDQLADPNTDEEWRIERPVYEVSSYIVTLLYGGQYASPKVLSHGRTSVVFNWTNDFYDAYLTITSHTISALISDHNHIVHRRELTIAEIMDLKPANLIAHTGL